LGCVDPDAGGLGNSGYVWGTGEYDRLMVIKKRANTVEHRIEHLYVRMKGHPAYEDQWSEA
jgi:hypothetical protein